jgi:predicted fused transcriptional regulator/phosphomethylpyrimidine kinase
MAYTKFAGALIVNGDHVELLHVKMALESNNVLLQWHIARILHKFNRKYHAQQAATNVRCTTKIINGSKNTPTPTCHDRKK